MQQSAGFALYDEDTALQAFKLRKRLSISTGYRSGIPQFLQSIRVEEHAYLSQFLSESGRQSFLNVLEGFKDRWIRLKGVTPTKAKTCAETLLQVGANPLLLTALSFYNQGRVSTFLSYYDYSDGMMEVAGAILGAVTELEGKGQMVADKATARFSRFEQTLDTGTSELMSQAIKSEHEQNAALFTQDPSGILFLDYIVSQLEAEAENPHSVPYQRILPYESAELVIAGARFGKQTYQQLYKLWSGEDSV